MRVLGIDTSSDVGTVAVLVDGRLRASVSTRVQHQHGETLLPHLERALALAEVPIESLDLVAVGLGPGSFTGVRIGVATAKGLSLARGTPLIGVRTSRVLARASFGELRAVVIDAKKDEVFVAAYRALPDGTLEPLLEDAHGSAAATAALLAEVRAGAGPSSQLTLVGSALEVHAAIYREALGPLPVFLPAVLGVPSAAILALEGSEAMLARGADDPAALVPIYVRAADAKLPAAKLPAAELPAAELPAAKLPAAELPAAELPAAELPAAELPAAELPDASSAKPSGV